MSISQATIIGLPQPQSWDEYERGCLASFGGGYQSEAERLIFRHGMRTVFNLLRDEFPPAGVCKTASPLEVVTCVYCGHEYGPGTPASNHPLLTEHIARCPKHPMRAVVEERDALLRACETGACSDDTTKLSFANTLRQLANELPGNRMSGLSGCWSDMLEAKADELEVAIAKAKGNQ